MVETDLISRQAAIDEFDGVKVNEENCTEYDIGFNDGIDFAISKLSVLPSAQPEIIRCKDCKHYKNIRRTKRWFCSNDLGINTLETNPDDYCSNAERRTDETD